MCRQSVVLPSRMRMRVLLLLRIGNPQADTITLSFQNDTLVNRVSSDFLIRRSDIQHLAESVRSLKSSDVQLVKDLQEVGNTVMNNLGIPAQSTVMGFHIPPFNSVYHLHLHVQALPYVSLRSAAKYPVRPGLAGYSKGLSWFAEVKQTIEILERGRRVGILPC